MTTPWPTNFAGAIPLIIEQAERCADCEYREESEGDYCPLDNFKKMWNCFVEYGEVSCRRYV